MLSALAIAGSLRRGSLNRRLLEHAAALAPPELRVVVHPGLGDLPPFDEDLEPGPAAVAELRRAVAAADGVLLATPEYNQSFPGVLKNAIDWLSRAAPDEPLAGKPVALVGATAGRWGTRLAQAGLRPVLAATGALVLPAPMLFVADGERGLDDARTADGLRRLLAAFATWIARVA